MYTRLLNCTKKFFKITFDLLILPIVFVYGFDIIESTNNKAPHERGTKMTFFVNDNFNGTVDIYFGSEFKGTMNVIAFIKECDILLQWGHIEWM